MSFNWIQMIPFVEHLYEKSDELPSPEGVLRTVVNRAYYIALNTAATYVIETIGEKLPEDERYHKEVSKHIKDEENIHRLLGLLREKRKKVDYDMPSRNFDAMAYCAINEVKEFIEFPEFKKLFTE